MPLTPAKFWKTESGKVRCFLCPHNCLISDGKNGVCIARTNSNGALYSRIYGEVTSYSMDPIEKKPLYHFYPGSSIYSVGTWGCNFKCLFCQNWEISQQEFPAAHFEPGETVKNALAQRSVGVGYTYNEPFIWYEYIYDTAVIARKHGLKNVIVTNGYVSEEPLDEILPLIDAMNIDLKSFSDDFYRKTCKGGLAPVLKTVEKAFKAGVHVELTTLVIPTLNDGDDIQKAVDWVAALSPDIPLHFSRYFPQYKMDLPPTATETLLHAYEIGKKKLKYVYVGNVPSKFSGSDTVCPGCGAGLIKRSGYDTEMTGMSGNSCAKCGRVIYGRY